MDLVMLVLVLSLVGFLVYLLTTKVPMPPYWATAIQILALIVVVVYLLQVLGAGLPNVLP